jgi:hypothetical protein
MVGERDVGHPSQVLGSLRQAFGLWGALDPVRAYQFGSQRRSGGSFKRVDWERTLTVEYTGESRVLLSVRDESGTVLYRHPHYDPDAPRSG